MSDINIKYFNEFRHNNDPLVLDRYIYIVVSEGSLTYLVHDSFFDENEARAYKRTKEAEEEKFNLPFRNTYSIHKSRLYK